MVPSCADAEQLRAATGGVLFRDQPQPGGELTSLVECSPLADRSHDRTGDQRPHSRYLSQAPAKSLPS
jgi:hypothetical protein